MIECDRYFATLRMTIVIRRNAVTKDLLQSQYAHQVEVLIE